MNEVTDTFGQELGKVFVKAAVAAAGATIAWLAVNATAAGIAGAFQKAPMPTQAQAQAK